MVPCAKDHPKPMQIFLKDRWDDCVRALNELEHGERGTGSSADSCLPWLSRYDPGERGGLHILDPRIVDFLDSGWSVSPALRNVLLDDRWTYLPWYGS